MHTLLQKLLERRQVDIKELTKDEKKDFDRWESTLQGKDLTVDAIADFCVAQIHAIEAQWENLDNTPEKNERLVLLHTVWSKLRKMILANEQERIRLEKYLTELIDTDTESTL